MGAVREARLGGWEAGRRTASPLRGAGTALCSSGEDLEAPACPRDQISGTVAGIPRSSSRRSGNVGTGPGMDSAVGRGLRLVSDGGEGFAVTGVNARVRDDGRTIPSGTRALPRSRRQT